MDKNTRKQLIKCFKMYYELNKEYQRERDLIINSRPVPMNFGKGYDTSDPTFSKANQLEKLDKRYDGHFLGMKSVELLLNSLSPENKAVLIARIIFCYSVRKVEVDMYMSRRTVFRRTDEAFKIYYSICQGLKMEVGTF